MNAINHKAKFDYHLFDSFEAGIVLKGSEVKSILKNKVDLERAYVVFKKNELFLINANIPPNSSKQNLLFSHEPLASRKLLLHKNELLKIANKIKEQKYTLIPLNLHWNHKKIKLTFAFAKKKKIFDKRQAKKEKELIRKKIKL